MAFSVFNSQGREIYMMHLRKLFLTQMFTVKGSGFNNLENIIMPNTSFPVTDQWEVILEVIRVKGCNSNRFHFSHVSSESSYLV